LSHQRTRQKRAAGATTLSKAYIKGKLVEFMWYLKKQGYARDTIENRPILLKRLLKRGANLYDPENVKKVLANQESWNDGTKVQIRYAYESFLKMEGLTWKPPKYRQQEKLPFVPLEDEIDQLINSCGRTMSIFLQGLKETGADPGELHRVEWTDINEKARKVTINHPVKRHNPRILTVSRNWIERLKLLPNESTRIFIAKMSSMETNFYMQRKRKAREFKNPRLLKLTFTSIRHWKATMEYHRTQDILHVKQLLGHKRIGSTMVYIDIERALYGDHEDDDFISRCTRSDKGARVLIDAGFEYICTTPNDTMLFRKRK